MERDLPPFSYRGHMVEVKGEMAGTAITTAGQHAIIAPMHLLVIVDGQPVATMPYHQTEEEESVIERAKALVGEKTSYRHEVGPKEIRTTITGPPSKP
jgi:hypothetical protein